MGLQVYLTLAVVYLYYLDKIKWYLILWYVVSHAMRAYFFYASGSNKWWLSLVPFGTWFNYRETSCAAMGWIIAAIISGIISLRSFVALPVLFLAYGMLETEFKNVTFDCNVLLYAWIPFYRYVVMYKEAKLLMSE